MLTTLAACSSDGVAPAATRATIPVSADGTLANPFRVGRPLVIPHAGGDALFPENTLYAFEQSQALGGDVIDIDVWVSADGVPVAMHDSTVDRTTDGTGAVGDLTAQQLSKLDAAYDFTSDGGHPYRGTGIGVPTVEQILRRFPDRLATLDMKDQRTGSAEPVCALLQSLKRSSRTYVGVDTNDQVVAFRQNCPEIYTSGTSEERQASRTARETNDLTFRSNQLVSQPGFIGSDGARRVTATTLEFSHRNGTAVLTWIVDEPAMMSELIDMGIDGIYTRRPDLLLTVLRARGLL